MGRRLIGVALAGELGLCGRGAASFLIPIRWLPPPGARWVAWEAGMPSSPAAPRFEPFRSGEEQQARAKRVGRR